MPARRKSSRPPWADWPDEKLLDLRFCDLKLKIAGTNIEPRIQQLYDELEHRGLKFRPHCWLSTEWFAPDGVPGIGIPFYLAHPRLYKLEDHYMLEVEGGTKTWCMRLLRHETGHAIETAFRLGRRAGWRRHFGRSSKPYPTSYRPKPFSFDYVQHLDWWYAQSHPSEDFAETFAVWLRPASQWRKRYRGWKALKKLEYVDELMGELRGKTPPVRSREQVEPLSEIKATLLEHYEQRQDYYGSDYPDVFDRDLRRLFAEPSAAPKAPSAVPALRKLGPQIRRIVSNWTGVHAYTVAQGLREMISRSRELDLRMVRPIADVRLDAAVMLTMQVTQYMHSNEHRLVL